MRLFHARRFSEARTAFQLAQQGPERDVAQRAGLHVRMCDQRLKEAQVDLKSAEELYNYAVALLNTRDVEPAREYLERALEMEPKADHIHYALALALAMGGNLEDSHHHLTRAIELEPRNRIAARQDADFAPYVNQQPLESLLFPEKRGW